MIRKNILYLFYMVAMLVIQNSAYGQTYTLQKDGGNIYAWNGISIPGIDWGANLVYEVTNSSDGVRQMGPLGGIPVVVIFNEKGNGIAVFNTTPYFEHFEVKVTNDKSSVSISGSNASHVEVYEFTNGDYFEPLRHFADIMKAKGISTKTAPESAFRAMWETYGYEEDWDKSIVTDKIDLLKGFGIGALTFDSGCLGNGKGNNWESMTGDFPVNSNVIGSESDLKDLINTLHANDFFVRLWWVPAVAEEDYQVHAQHPDWFLTEVIPSTGAGETGDWYLDLEKEGISEWNQALVERFISYGFDGFKQDDVYQIISTDTAMHKAYNQLFTDIIDVAHTHNPDFQVNTCNCGIAQNFYDFPGQNQLITSDPVGANQFRWRAKYLHGLNVNGAAILGDHIELTEGDVGTDDIDNSSFYSKPDFASVVALGMVLQTKFTIDPGAKYQKWFDIYNTYKFYNMEWINIPQVYTTTEPERYLMKDGEVLYPSFFMQDVMRGEEVSSYRSYDGEVTITNLESGTKYSIYNLSTDKHLENFTASGTTHTLSLSFTRSVVLQVKEGTWTSAPEGTIKSNLMIYPNPANNQINFDLPSSNDSDQLAIFSFSGQMLYTQAIVEAKNCIDISYFENGLYFIQSNGTQPHVAKFIKK